MMSKSDVGKRNFLEFQEKAQKYDTIANRLKESEAENNKKDDTIFKLNKEKQDYVNQINKWKNKVEER